MLYELESFAALCSRTYSVADLTVIIAVRAHEGNPWVLQRLALLGRYYDPMPHVILVDFGSSDAFAAELERISRTAGYEYVAEPDFGTFSLARARNIGVCRAKTDLLFFSDVDCFGERDLFARLIHQANILGFGACFDQIMVLPVFHLSEAVTTEFFGLDEPQKASAYLEAKLVRALHSPRGSIAEFVDPSSNFFVCHRTFYDLVGGFNEKFRGHGSEDYEFQLRYTLLAGQFPMPATPREDHYGVTRDAFYGAKQYRGFRRLGEAMAFQSQAAGLRIAHLYHPRPKDTDTWYRDNDWKRSRFTAEVTPFLQEASEVLRYDWMPRPRSVLILLGHRWQYEFFLPLRLAGYRLHFIVPGDAAGYQMALDMIEKRTVDAVAMFNPYMKSHAAIRPFFELARKAGLSTIVVERGMLPESWYYAGDVSYNDPDWCPASVAQAELTFQQLEIVDQYIEGLKRGGSTLESMGSMAETLARYGVYARLHPRTCFIPFQLDDDMAVTQYTAGHQSYASFRAQVETLVAENPDVLFFIKNHPLSKNPLNLTGPNVIACTAEDNVHGMLELVNTVICYNSGVGFLGLIHGKRVVTVGNAFYNFPGFGQRARDFAHAVELGFDTKIPFNTGDLRRLVGWLLFRKYSFYKAESVIKEFSDRRAHNYQNLRCYQFNFETTHVSHLRAQATAPCSPTSYASGILGLQVRPGNSDKQAAAQAQATPPQPPPQPQPPAEPKLAPQPPAKPRSLRAIRRKFDKLTRNPKGFFADSALPSLRWIGNTWLK